MVGEEGCLDDDQAGEIIVMEDKDIDCNFVSVATVVTDKEIKSGRLIYSNLMQCVYCKKITIE